MARYPYRQQPQMVDTGNVPYISYTSEQAEPLMMQAAANAQQRYDLAQTAIAKYLEENAAAKFRDADYNTAMAKLNQDLENIKTIVKDRYDNQYGQAYPEILKGLSKARQTYHLAQKAYEEEQKYAPMYAKLQSEGKLIFPEGDPRTKSVFNQEGQYVGGVDFSKFRERSDYDKTIEDAIVRGIDKTAVESGLINSKTAGYLMQLQQSGLAALTPEKIDQIAEEYAPIFEKQTTYGIDPERPQISSKEYVKDAIYRLAGSKTGRQYIADRNYDPSKDSSTTPPTTGVLSGVGMAKGTSFTIKDFENASPNYRNPYVSLQSGEPLKSTNYGLKDYSEKKIDINQYRAAQLEQNIRRNSPYMKELFTEGSKDTKQLVKEAGFKSYDEYKRLSSTQSGGLEFPEMQKFEQLVLDRNEAANTYSKELRIRAEKAITDKSWDTSSEFQYFQPSYTNAKDVEEFERFEKSFQNKATNPGDFTFLSGALRGKSVEEVSTAYKTKEGRDVPFSMPSVGGNESIGLIWEVITPDGGKADAKWNAGYQKQAQALVKVYNMPEMLKALNADVIDIGDNGIISPNEKKYPDAPKEVFEGFEKLTQEGKKKGPLRAFPATDDIDKVILQMPDNQFVVKRKGADGIDYIDYTSIESEATPVTKGEIFGILALNGRNSK